MKFVTAAGSRLRETELGREREGAKEDNDFVGSR